MVFVLENCSKVSFSGFMFLFSSIRKWTLNIKIDWSLKRISKLVLVALLCYCDAGIWLFSFNFNVICMTEHWTWMCTVLCNGCKMKCSTWIWHLSRPRKSFDLNVFRDTKKRQILSSSFLIKITFSFSRRWYDKRTWIHLLALFAFIVFFFSF